MSPLRQQELALNRRLKGAEEQHQPQELKRVEYVGR
jgi:hypothetical protein